MTKPSKLIPCYSCMHDLRARAIIECAIFRIAFNTPKFKKKIYENRNCLIYFFELKCLNDK